MRNIKLFNTQSEYLDAYTLGIISQSHLKNMCGNLLKGV